MKKLSPLELEVLQYIYEAGTTTAPDVHAQIAKKRQTAYSTIKTVFDRLEKKGAIYRKSQVGRTSIYAPKETETSVQTSLLRDFVTRVFPKDKTPLFNTLIRDTSLSEEEVVYLERLLEEKRK
ncbi:MAG: BlaI/MecI/CopY family transcriptional regulator [Proteobacteria bacterium]|jgi:BlaI family penicillinase repressor|nr:BlaI/MecI/CopY family transcriptional regulator [Pseudomonadota bacterium]MDA1299701.1 BlaI/MecI/CopY family transcriptional regulator [Pseudomonadota bacterium]